MKEVALHSWIHQEVSRLDPYLPEEEDAFDQDIRVFLRDQETVTLQAGQADESLALLKKPRTWISCSVASLLLMGYHAYRVVVNSLHLLVLAVDSLLCLIHPFCSWIDPERGGTRQECLKENWLAMRELAATIPLHLNQIVRNIFRITPFVGHHLGFSYSAAQVLLTHAAQRAFATIKAFIQEQYSYTLFRTPPPQLPENIDNYKNFQNVIEYAFGGSPDQPPVTEMFFEALPSLMIKEQNAQEELNSLLSSYRTAQSQDKKCLLLEIQRALLTAHQIYWKGK